MPRNVEGECAEFEGGTRDVYGAIWEGEFAGG